ncbi:MAG: DUF2914 domain-containing protein [Idiomarina sp.]|nr:DUF2914 domain-containing protein [Idiomarina sp.]
MIRWLLGLTVLLLSLPVPAALGATDGVWNRDHIQRAVLTTGIENREPVDDLGSTYVHSGDPEQRLILFTQVVNHNNRGITHLWFFDDRLQAEIPLRIGSENWRTFSSKVIPTNTTGEWRILVVSDDQEILLEYSFTVTSPE